MILKRIISGIAVFMALSVSFMVNAGSNSGTYNGYEYVIENNGAIIKNFSSKNASEITSLDIIDTIKHDGEEYDVIGIENLAFTGLENLESIYVPDTLQNEYMGNVAFVNEKSLVNYIEKCMGGNISEKSFLETIAENLQYNGKTEGWTDEELAEIREKLNEKAYLAGVTDGMDAEDAAILMIKNKDKMNLSERTEGLFEIWIAAMTYTDMTVYANPDTEIYSYLKAIEIMGLKLETAAVTGDANLDGKVTVRDCAFIANKLAKGLTDELPLNADYNSDGKVNVRDAAALANYLANK